jgi:hypothetical protein
MYAEDVYENLRDWSEKTLFLIRDLLPLMSPVSQYAGWTDEQRRTLGPLLGASARSGEGALLLTAYAQLWEAEILVRSVLEASLKFAYLLQNPASFEVRHREYRHDLFRIGLLKDHAKVADLLAAVPNPDDAEWRPMRERLLSDDEREAFSKAYPKPVRSALDTRWGFTGMIRELVKSADPLFRDFAGLASNYAMASHIIHADHIGTSVPSHTDRRPPEERDALLKAHGVRLMSDVMTSLQIRLSVGYRFIGHDLAPLVEANAAMEKLQAGFGPVYEDWMSVQYSDDSATQA